MAKRGRSRRNRTKTRTKSKITTSCQDTTMTETSNEPAKSTTNKSPDICQSGAVDGLTFPSPKDMKKDPFDELLGSHCDELYLDHDAVKVTYTNRKQKNNSNKSNTEYHDEVVHFRDNKNRDMILKWLNDSQNVFDRLTQTQEPASQRRIDDVWMEDMPPSVSQNLPKHSPKIQQKLNKCKQKGQCRKNTTSKPRAKSLDIVITKQNRGRVKRHSITIDLRSSKNDNIDNNTNNNNNGNVRTILLKMAEEEYLNSLDEELKDYKNGWDRMEKIKKTLRRTTRNKAQLDITLHNTPQRLQQNSIKKNDNILDNLTKEEIMNLNYPVFNLDEFEDFVGENMEETPENLSSSNNCCGYHNGDIQIEYNRDDSNLNIVEKCKDFIIVLENLQINELTQLQEYYRRIETIFNKITQKSNKETQHPPISLIDDEVETIVEEIIKKSVDSSKSFTNIGIQTDFEEITQKFNIDVEIQTVIEPKCDKSIQSSLKLLVDVGMQTMNVGELEQVPHGEEESKIEDFQDSQLLHCFNFETEDFLKGSQTVIEKKIVEKPAIIEENHVNTPSDNNELIESATKQPNSQNRGTKRQSDQDIDEDNCNKKQRPCEKFIPDDLSIEFADTENIDKIVDTTVVNNDNNVNNQRTRTQELIEECDFLIQNVTKQKLQKNDDKHKTDTDEVFEENSMFINEENMSKINKDIDLFEANSSQDDNNSNKENIEKTPAKTRNNSRKNLFGKDEDTDEILISSNKINILENITLKNPNDEDDDDVIIIGSQNDDIIETTPQKNLSIYEKRSSFLDITLPPPLEFQDNEEKSSSFNRNINNNKKYRHSTPNSNKFSSDFISLSPITLEKNPLELAQQSFQSLTIHMRPVTPSNRQHSQTKQRSILNYLSHSSRSQSQEIPLTPSQKPCIACTRINNDQLLLITALTNKKLATYSSTFTQKVTHMIVSVDDSNCVKDHTIKYVSAVAAGIWVLNIQWIQECLTKNCIVPEEEFEVLDLSGIDGPKQSRLKHATQPLLKNYKIYAAQPFLSTTQHDVENIVKLVGGKIVTHPESFLNKDGSICVIITEAKDTQDTNLYESWLEMFKVITVDIEWLSRSVGQYRVLSLRPFSLCSEDSILSLEYPKELLAEVPFSFSQDTYPVPIN